MTTAELQERILELGMPKFTAKQISQWVYQKGATTFDEMTNISKKHRELLDAHFVVGRMPATDKQTSKDGTVK